VEGERSHHCAIPAPQDQNQSGIKPANSPVLITLLFKDQKSADSVRRQLSDLGKKIDHVLQPVLTRKEHKKIS